MIETKITKKLPDWITTTQPKQNLDNIVKGWDKVKKHLVVESIESPDSISN